MLFKLLTALPLAQTAPEEGAPALPDPGPSPMAIFSNSSLRRADLLNHPEKLAQALTELNIVWAVIFMVLGAICVFNGYRWHKLVIVLLAGLGGVWAGVEYGDMRLVQPAAGLFDDRIFVPACRVDRAVAIGIGAHDGEM